MEFPDLGKNCSADGCNTLDFLPILCECGKTFCDEHFLDHSFTCGNIDNLLTELPKKSQNIMHKCSFETCDTSTLNYFPCAKCGEHFCVAHRFHKQCETSEEELEKQKIRLNAPKEQFKEAKKTVDQQVTANIEKAKQNPKKFKTACKLQVMRLKNKAKGQESIPFADRVYCLVYLPNDSNPKSISATGPEANIKIESNNVNVKSQAIFISKQWTLGKVIDSISNICNIVNNNSKPDGNKLRLFKHSTGAIVHHLMGTTLADLFMQEIVCDGESVILEYINSQDSNLQNIYLKQFNLYC